MRYTLSFGYLNLVTPDIVELIIDNNAIDRCGHVP